MGKYYRGKRPTLSVVVKTYDAMKALQDGKTREQVRNEFNISVDFIPRFPESYEIRMEDAYNCRLLNNALLKADRTQIERILVSLLRKYHPEVAIFTNDD